MFADEFERLLEEACQLQLAMIARAELNLDLAEENHRLAQRGRACIRRSRALLERLDTIEEVSAVRPKVPAAP